MYIYIYIYIWGRQLAGGWAVRRIHQGCFRDVFPTGISALGYLWGWGKMQFYFRVKSLPGDNPNRPAGPILDQTVGRGAQGTLEM